MNPNPSHPRFEDLLRSLLDGDPSPPGSLAEIEEAMHRDASLQREFLDQMELDTLLFWELGGHRDGELESLPSPRLVTEKKIVSRIPVFLAVAAAITLVFAAGILFGNRAGASSLAPSRAVAVLIEGEDCVWNLEGGLEPVFGSVFADGQSLRIRSGVARLAMRNRAGIAVEGPALVDLVSSEIVRVREGRVSAYAPDEAIGFTVLTPGVEIVDLGTRFAANVEKDGTTDVHVFEGEISVRGTRKGEPAAESELVTSGQARRYGVNGTDRSEIAVDPESFVDPPDLEQLLAATGSSRGSSLERKTEDSWELNSETDPAQELFALQDFTRGDGDLDGSLGGSGFADIPWLANRSFTRLIPNVLSHSGETGAGGYLLVRGREKAEPFVANRMRRELASSLPEEFVFAIRASFHGLDEDDFFSLWLDVHGREDASHSTAPTLGIREGRFFARLDLEHTAFGEDAADGEEFVLAGRHTWDPRENRARIELWLNPIPGASPDGAVSGPLRPKGQQTYRFLGLRMGQYTEVSDRLLVRAVAIAPSLEPALRALGE